MMYIHSRKRKSVSLFSSFVTNSFLLFSPHFPLNLNGQSNCKRKKTPHSEDPNAGPSSSSTPLHEGDYEDGEEQWKGDTYEVFLSFRGQDTRKGFTDYLYTSLTDAGIHVFRDDNELRVGEKIGPMLLDAIAQSKILIPIISESYFLSKWCLRELAYMLKCKRSIGLKVFPIFYKVEPSQLRHFTGRFANAINAHKENMNERVIQQWVEALKEVSFLKGWESEKIGNGHEGVLVELVVKKVMSQLERPFELIVSKELVGTDDRADEIIRLIGAKFHDTCIIGIYGMGGIGKTTLAKVLFNKISNHFKYRSFVANIRETSQHMGTECLQKQLISDILGSPVDVSNIDKGINVIKSRFTSKKVIILLDNVDDNTHLDALVGDGSWFEAGSIIIITTRNRSFLNGRASHMYPLEELSWEQSLVLFCRHAFRDDSPPKNYEVISRDVIFTTGGLPLALEVIGSFLRDKGEEVWKDTLKKLKKMPDKKVQETLRISYDALDHMEQQIFLDIACFFIGSFKQSPTYMWDACHFFPWQGIEVLSLMSLIKIDEDGKLMMHDQLRDLGREIVHLENLKEPQQRSRLWNDEDAIDVLDVNKGTGKIEGLCLDKSGQGRNYTCEQFKELSNLRFLQMKGINLIGDFQKLLPQLRWLQWMCCPSDFKATNFHPKKLVVLDLYMSEITETWGGWGPLKMATELKVLSLMGCQSLRRTPKLSTFNRLEILILEDCENLEEIHHSIGDITTLVSLNAKSCWRLKKLPTGVGRMENLRELFLDKTYIQEIPISRGGLMKLETLCASSCRQLVQLPEFIGSLISLQCLSLSECHLLRDIPHSIGQLTSLTELDLKGTAIEELPESIGSLKELETLDASYCASLAGIPSSIGSLKSLQRLLLRECQSLREIPNSIGRLTSLTKLDLNKTAIEELPDSIGSLKKLKILDASFCASLVRIPSSIGNLASLSLLDLTKCVKLALLPDSIGLISAALVT